MDEVEVVDGSLGGWKFWCFLFLLYDLYVYYAERFFFFFFVCMFIMLKVFFFFVCMFIIRNLCLDLILSCSLSVFICFFLF